MRHLLRCLLPSALLLLLATPAVWACANDREVKNAEREFKSSYQVPQPGTESPPPSEEAPTLQAALRIYGPLTLGGLLLAGAVVQVVRRTGTPRP